MKRLTLLVVVFATVAITCLTIAGRHVYLSSFGKNVAKMEDLKPIITYRDEVLQEHYAISAYSGWLTPSDTLGTIEWEK